MSLFWPLKWSKEIRPKDAQVSGLEVEADLVDQLLAPGQLWVWASGLRLWRRLDGTDPEHGAYPLHYWDYSSMYVTYPHTHTYMYMCSYAYMYTCIHVYIRTHVHSYAQIHVSTHAYGIWPQFNDSFPVPVKAKTVCNLELGLWPRVWV